MQQNEMKAMCCRSIVFLLLLQTLSILQRLYFKGRRHATLLWEKGCVTAAKETKYLHSYVTASHKIDMGSCSRVHSIVLY